MEPQLGLAASVVSRAIADIGARSAMDAVVGTTHVTQKMIDHDVSRPKDFDAAIARANLVHLQTSEAKNGRAKMILEKWNKFAAGYAAVSNQMFAITKSRIHDFIRDGDVVAQTRNRIDQKPNKRIIQAVAFGEVDKTTVLLPNPMEIWRPFMDAYATQNPLPTVDAIFRAMEALEERWNN